MTLGQRVAVLRGGVLQQCDTPEQLFDHPANLFVAAFIGSPAMNLVEARRRRGRFGTCRVPLAGRAAAACSASARTTSSSARASPPSSRSSSGSAPRPTSSRASTRRGCAPPRSPTPSTPPPRRRRPARRGRPRLVHGRDGRPRARGGRRPDRARRSTRIACTTSTLESGEHAVDLRALAGASPGSCRAACRLSWSCTTCGPRAPGWSGTRAGRRCAGGPRPPGCGSTRPCCPCGDDRDRVALVGGDEDVLVVVEHDPVGAVQVRMLDEHVVQAQRVRRERRVAAGPAEDAAAAVQVHAPDRAARRVGDVERPVARRTRSRWPRCAGSRACSTPGGRSR